MRVCIIVMGMICLSSCETDCGDRTRVCVVHEFFMNKYQQTYYRCENICADRIE